MPSTRSFKFQKQMKPINSVGSFLTLLRALKRPRSRTTPKRPERNPRPLLYFRGEPEEHALIPSIGRAHRYLGMSGCFDTEQEQWLLHRFRRRAYAILGRTPSEWEALFLARH